MKARYLVPLLIAAAPLLSGCSNNQSAAQDQPKKPRDEFAQDQVVDMPKPAPFDAKRAMKYLRDVCDLGSRVSGSEGMRKQQELLKTHFEKLGGKVSIQRFEAKQNSQPRPIPMANLVVSFHPDRERRILLCSHYDTRPLADQEPDRRNWTKPFASANDGTSGVAWLMELAHHIKNLPLNIGIDFAFFDGEETIYEPGKDLYFFGSKHFAEQYRKQKKPVYMAGVLLDLFAGKNAKFGPERNSMFLAGAVVEDIWRTAFALGVKQFRNDGGHEVEDDHLALNHAGIPTVDIIDFDYPHWHKLSDTPENCSEESMAAVAQVLTVWLQRIK